MDRTRKTVLAIAMGGLMVAGGALGGGLLNAGAADSTSKPKASPSGAFQPNEDATHEKSESAAREAAEDSGKFPGHRERGGGDHGGGFPNEDPAHEAGESAAREKAEHAADSGGGSGAGSGDSSSNSGT
jgi:hypothetical protein